jgi:hypothetical protein
MTEIVEIVFGAPRRSTPAEQTVGVGSSPPVSSHPPSKAVRSADAKMA